MATKSSPAPYKLNSVDRRGRKIDSEVLAAAEEIFPRALDYSLNVLGDSAVVANMLEEVAARTTRLLKAKDPPGEPAPIHNLAAYVFRAFARDVNRLRSKQLVLVSASEASKELPRWTDPSRQLMIKILTDEFLARCDSVTQDVFALRMQGFSWEEIGRTNGISAHAAEKRFSQAFRRAVGRLKMLKRAK
jgi:DNA-directed RNA polymerase specialized sigma24 family protein